MNKLKWWLLTWLIKDRLSESSYSTRRVSYLFNIISEMCVLMHNEDNWPTIEDWLRSRFETSLYVLKLRHGPCEARGLVLT